MWSSPLWSSWSASGAGLAIVHVTGLPPTLQWLGSRSSPQGRHSGKGQGPVFCFVLFVCLISVYVHSVVVSCCPVSSVVVVIVCMCVSVCLCLCLCVYVYICVCICVYVCMYACVYICMYVCMYMCVCVCVCQACGLDVWKTHTGRQPEHTDTGADM